MKQGRAIGEVLTELRQQQEMKFDYVAPAKALQLADNGETFILSRSDGTQELFGTTELFHRQTGAALNIPAKYYDQMRERKPELLARNVNAWFGDKQQNYMIRALGRSESPALPTSSGSGSGDIESHKVARALLSDRYHRIDNIPIATTALSTLANQEGMEIVSSTVTSNYLFLKVVNHRLEEEVKPGDVVQAGVMIRNSEVGLGAVSVQPLVYRLVCSNGLIVNDFKERRKGTRRNNLNKSLDCFIIS